MRQSRTRKRALARMAARGEAPPAEWLAEDTRVSEIQASYTVDGIAARLVNVTAADRSVPQPLKYTPETVGKVLEAIRVGAPRHLAAKYAGINPETMVRWQHEQPGFLDAIELAEGKGAVTWLNVIEHAAVKEGEWAAAAWKLERKYPKDFAKRTFIDLEDRLRAAAIAEGLDPDAVLGEGRQLLGGGGS